MFKVTLYDPRNGIFKAMEFKSLALALAKSKEQEKYRVMVEDGTQKLLCIYNSKYGWIVDKGDKNA